MPMDAFDALMQGPWKELGQLLVPAAYRAPASQRPAELKYLKTRITYAELFDNKPTWDQFFSRLMGIGLRTAIGDLSYINSVLHVNGVLKSQERIVSGAMDADLRERIARIPNWRDRVVFSPPQLQMVMKAAILHSPDQEDVRDTPTYGRDMAEMLLMANDLLDPQTDHAVQAAQTRADAMTALLAHSVRSTLANFSERYEYALGRSSVLFNQFAGHVDVRNRAGNEWMDLEDRFRQIIGLSFADYFAIGWALVGWFRSGADHPEKPDQRKLIPATFFSKTKIDSAAGTSLLQWLMHDYSSARQAFTERAAGTRLFGYDVVPFMGRPLYRITDDMAVPTSLAFLEARVTTGMYWILFDSMPADDDKERVARIYGHMVEAYVHHVVAQALPTVAGLGQRVFSDFIYKDGKNERRTSDVVVVYPNAAVFMEVTTSRLGMDLTILVDDPAAVEADFKKTVVKKAKQLDAQIEHFRAGRFAFGGLTAATIKTIVPVVVMADAIPMWTATMGTIQGLLADAGLLQGPGIEPLRVIGLDEIELLEPLVLDGRSLYDILRTHATNAEYRNVSLRNFLEAHYPHLRNNRLFDEFTRVHEHARALLFSIDGPSHADIAVRAHELFELRGRTHGHDLGVRPSNRRANHVTSCCAPTRSLATLGDGRVGVRAAGEPIALAFTCRGDRA